MEEHLGKYVDVVVDRPIGSRHPEHGFIYPVNYGYVPGTCAGDGEPVDAYVLGVFEPVREYRGRVIAIIRRRDDNEDKLVVAETLYAYGDEAIRALTEFQERYFDIEIQTYVRVPDKGSIRVTVRGLVRRDDKVLVVKALDGPSGNVFYHPPGGGVEFGETSDQALRREFREELGVEISECHQLFFQESIFTHEGQTCHEVCIVYEAYLPADACREDKIPLREGGAIEDALWVKTSDFLSGDKTIYPTNLKHYL